MVSTLDIFSETEGYSGENLSTALLNYFFNNSPEIRKMLIRLLAPSAEIQLETDCFCKTEYSTCDDKGGKGRIDLFIKIKGAVIGIENKFNADFQEGQPGKYIATLKNEAKEGDKVYLYVLCPKNRKKVADKIIEEIDNSFPVELNVLTWEEVVEELNSLKEIENHLIKSLKPQFINYINRKIDLFHNYETNFEVLRNEITDGISAEQNELLNAIYAFFPDPGKFGESKGRWAGYGFYTNKISSDYIGWFGFIPRKYIDFECKTLDVELIIETSARVPERLGIDFELIEDGLNKEVALQGNSNKTWVVKFTKDMDAKKWEKMLKHFHYQTK